MKRKIAFKTLGCRLNQAETDSLLSQFHKGAYEVVPFSDEADVYIINTCTVTNQSDQKSRNIINQAGRKGQPLVVVTGCMADHFKDQLEGRDQITYVIPNEHKNTIFDLVEAYYKGEQDPVIKAGNRFDYAVAEKSLHTRCAVKIQDGCDNFCTFCIIPSVRGRAVSRPVADIRDNIVRALDLGYREMVLTGVNIGRYRHEAMNFERLVEEIVEIPGDFRLRISSIEPDGFGDRFLDVLGHPKMCPHLHLCLQSGSERVLLRMRRMYTVAEYRTIIEKIRTRYPSFNFTTDVIVGFPGETDEDFDDTLQVIKQMAFSHVHTFPYSIRDHTRAARMEQQVPDRIKTQRSAIIRNLADMQKVEYLQTFMGKEEVVLTERIRSQTGKGYGAHYVPVELTGRDLKQNTFYRVRINGIAKGKNPVLQAIPLQ